MRKKLLLATFLMSLLLNLAMTLAATSPIPTTMAMSVVWDPDMPIGTLFTVDVYVDYVARLAAFQFELGKPAFGISGFDPSVLNLVSVDEGPFLGSAGGTVAWFPGDIDNTLGTLSLTMAILDPLRRFPTGGGVLATLTFIKVGDGSTAITFGGDTGLLDYKLRWVVKKTIDPEFVKDGFFSNEPGPELELPHGISGVWEEYQTILVGDTQTSYAKVRNWGSIGAWVEVDFLVRGPEGVETHPSNREWVPPFSGGVPGEVTLSASYIPGPAGKYYVKAVLYFQAGSMPSTRSYSLVVDTLGGEAETEDINVAFKVKTHM